jgi:DNA mismatch repair protein MutH
MERQDAIARLSTLIGKDVHALASKHGVQVRGAGGKVNKGWAGHVFERVLGLPINSAQAPNFGSWELKVVPLKRTRSGALRIKETMAITMIDPVQVKTTPFEDSHLLTKLRRAVIVAREVGDDVDQPSIIHSVNTLDLTGQFLKVVRADYEQVRACLNDPKRGFECLTGSMGTYVQPRTKGAGHGSTSRAFYARPVFLEQIIDLTSD